MPIEPVFFDLNLSESMGPATVKIAKIIGECGGSLYPLPRLRQVRAAYDAPVGDHNAKGVFIISKNHKDCIEILPPKRLWKDKAKSELAITICASFNDWDRLKERVREWSQQVKSNKKPPTSREKGDGFAISGGLPMTNHSKF
jgi:hypothetical protein